MSPHWIYCALLLLLCKTADLAAMCCYCHRGPIDFGGILHEISASFILSRTDPFAEDDGWQGIMADSILSTHILIESSFFYYFSFAEGGLSPKLISPPTPAMYKYRPAFSNNPKVHYHATAEQVSDLGSFCSQLMPGTWGWIQCRALVNVSVKVNNNTWHCCVAVYYFHCAPYGSGSDFTASPADTPVSLPGVHCPVPGSEPDDLRMLRSVTSHWLLLAEVPPHIPLRGSWACWVLLWIRPVSQQSVYSLIP